MGSSIVEGDGSRVLPEIRRVGLPGDPHVEHGGGGKRPKSQTCQPPCALSVDGCGATPLRVIASNQPLPRYSRASCSCRCGVITISVVNITPPRTCTGLRGENVDPVPAPPVGILGVKALPAAVARVGLQPGDPAFVSPDHPVDLDLLNVVWSEDFRSLGGGETKRNCATDMRLLLTFLSSRGVGWRAAAEQDLAGCRVRAT